MKKAIMIAGLAFIAGTLAAGNVLIKEDANSGKPSSTGVKITDQGRDGKKAFLVEGHKGLVLKDKFKIDPEKYYILSVWVKSIGDNSSLGYLGVSPYDAEGKQILSCHFSFVKGSETELAEPCKATDTVVKVKDASKWRNHKHFVIAFGAKDDKSDLPNRNVSSGIQNIEKKDDIYEITLDKPIGKDYPAGTKVREHQMGGYVYVKAGKIPNEWTKWAGKPLKGSMIRGGDAGRLVLLCNYGQKGQNMLFDELMVEEVDAPQKK